MKKKPKKKVKAITGTIQLSYYTNPVAVCCPVCGGNGLVSKGFYTTTTGVWTTTSIEFEPCQSCKGKGYVVLEAIEQGDSKWELKE